MRSAPGMLIKCLKALLQQQLPVSGMFVTECRLAAWLLLKAGLITSQMSCRIIRWCNRKKQTRKNDLVASDWWDEFWCHGWFLGSSLQLRFHLRETLHTTELWGQSGCFSAEWKVLELTDLSLNSTHLHFGAACEYEINVWNAKIFLKHLAFYLIPNFYMFQLIWSGNVLFFPTQICSTLTVFIMAPSLFTWDMIVL